MRALRTALAAFAAPFVVAACTASSPPADTADDAEAIRAVIAGYQQGLNAGDVDKATAMYAADAVFLPNEGPSQAGLPTIREYYRATTLANRFDAQFMTTDVQVSGDAAWATVAITGQQTPPGGTAYAFASKALFVLRRAPSGRWEVVRYIFNPNAPPTTPAP